MYAASYQHCFSGAYSKNIMIYEQLMVMLYTAPAYHELAARTNTWRVMEVQKHQEAILFWNSNQGESVSTFTVIITLACADVGCRKWTACLQFFFWSVAAFQVIWWTGIEMQLAFEYTDFTPRPLLRAAEGGSRYVHIMTMQIAHSDTHTRTLTQQHFSAFFQAQGPTCCMWNLKCKMMEKVSVLKGHAAIAGKEVSMYCKHIEFCLLFDFCPLGLVKGWKLNEAEVLSPLQ